MTQLTLAAMAALLIDLTDLSDAQEEGLTKAAKIVVTEAKDSLGSYQSDNGPYPAYAPLAEATRQDRVEKGFSADEPLKRTGALRDSIDYEVFADHAVVGSTDPAAPAHEMGTSTEPQRVFLAGAAYRKEEEIAELIGEAIFRQIVGK